MMRLVLLWSLALGAAAQDFANLRTDKVATGHVFTDGPVCSRDGYVIFSNVV